MSSPPPSTEFPTFFFDELAIKKDIYIMPADYTYTVVTADSIQLLSKRIIYFKELNPSWDYLGTLIFRESDGASYRLAQDTQAKTFYEGKLCQVFIKKEAAAVGGSIGQNSRKIRLQRKKRS